MANQELLDILKQGVETWNQWRKEGEYLLVDLTGANLIKATLGANLFSADLAEPDLRGNCNLLGKVTSSVIIPLRLCTLMVVR